MPGSKLLSLLVFVLTVGWAVWGQENFGHDDIDRILDTFFMK